MINEGSDNMVSMVYGDESRVFVNTAIGCDADCKYCYLPNVGVNKVIKSVTVEEVIRELNALPYIIHGKNGTIISLGCYSECWSEKNKTETIKFLSVVARWGNYIQIATKQSITEEEIYLLDSISLYKNQIGIYLSVPTISFSVELEKGTARIIDRLLPLHFISKIQNIYFVLYIKPVLEGITLYDRERYKELMEKYRVYAVVGSLLSVDTKARSSVLVGEGYLYENKTEEVAQLMDYLDNNGNVFEHSIDVIQKFKQEGTI